MIIVVEPHADDAFLSLGAHIEEWGQQAKIITVFSGTRKRARDAESYAKAVGCSWEGLGLVEGVDDVFSLPDRVQDTYIIPLGISHPEHIWVRDSFSTCTCARIWYYLDQPYASIQKHSTEVTNMLGGMEVVSYKQPGIRKYKHIPLFKDQAKFFHYNPAEKLARNIELIVRSPS